MKKQPEKKPVGNGFFSGCFYLFIVSNLKLSGKYLFFGKNFLTLHFKDGPLFLSIIYCKYKDKYSVELAPWKEIWIYVD